MNYIGRSYGPCVCENGCYHKVKCDRISSEQIHDAFQSKKPIYLKEIFLQLQDDESVIPSDIFAGHSSNKITLIGNVLAPDQCQLKIDTEAFHSSMHVTKIFIIESIDILYFDWNFLAGFKRLQMLSIKHAANTHILTLPPLPELIELQIYNSTGLSYGNYFPLSSNGVEWIKIQDCGKSQILDSILIGSLMSYLLYLVENALHTFLIS